MGFTLIELLVVMTIVATLLSIVLPRVAQRLDTAKEVVLKENLAGLRRALDQHLGDRGAYPETLQDLVRLRYLRAIPIDPMTDRRDSWVPMLRHDEDGSASVYDVHSGASGSAADGTAYSTW